MKPNSDLSMARKKEEKAPKKNESENKYERYMRFITEATNSANKEAPTTAKLGRYDQRCRCQKCYWTGYPVIVKLKPKTYQCGGCYCIGAIGGEVLTDWPTEKIPGIKLSLDYDTCAKSENGSHNVFIFDRRLSYGSSINRAKLAKIKETNEKYWFYCYSCKKYFLVPINAITHPKCEY